LSAWHLTQAIARTASADALLDAIVDVLDRKGVVSTEPPPASQVVPPEFMCETVDRLVQMLGSRGYDESTGAPRILRDARVYRVFEGPTESLLEFLGARGLMDQRTGSFAFLSDDLGAPVVAQELARAMEEMLDAP